MHSFHRRPSLFYILQEEAYRDCLCQFFQHGKKERAAIWMPCRAYECARVYTVTLTLLLQFNAFHREAGAPGFEDTSSRSHSADRTTAPQVLSNLWCSGNIYFSAYNGAAETRNRICKRIYISMYARASRDRQAYRPEIFCSRADD